MKFFHIADVHLGAEPDKGYPWSTDRSREIRESFQYAVQQAGREHAGLFLVAGDLFHRQPLVGELKEVNALFASIPQTKVVLIAGNHDYIKGKPLRERIKWASNVFWLEGEKLEYTEFADLGVRVYGFSYHSREIREARYDNLRPKDFAYRNILLAHGGDEKHIPINKETFLGSGFDYVALGHIHKPQIVEKNRAAYAGSLEPLDKNETGIHGYIQGEITSQGTSLSFVPCARREYRGIRIQVKETTTQFSLENTLEKAMQDRGMQHLYCITLEGKRAFGTEFLLDRLYALGNVREIQDNTRLAYSVEMLKEKYRGSILETYIRLLEQEKGEEEEKALTYGIEALLESGEELA